MKSSFRIEMKYLHPLKNMVQSGEKDDDDKIAEL
jgi:hypothetical protein